MSEMSLTHCELNRHRESVFRSQKNEKWPETIRRFSSFAADIYGLRRLNVDLDAGFDGFDRWCGADFQDRRVHSGSIAELVVSARIKQC